MKTFVCPECGQWNGHHMGCPETPEPLEFIDDEALDELEEKQRQRANFVPDIGFQSMADTED